MFYMISLRPTESIEYTRNSIQMNGLKTTNPGSKNIISIGKTIIVWLSFSGTIPRIRSIMEYIYVIIVSYSTG